MASEPPDLSPAEAPLTYPGRVPGASYVLLPGQRTLLVEERRDAGPGESGVDLPSHAAEPRRSSLDQVLRTHGAAPMDRRQAVLAVGSNASPAQLARKLDRRGLSTVVPLLRAHVSGLGVAASAHLNPRGYIPAAPVAAAPGQELPVFVTFLDEQQLVRVDESEPNYERVTLDPRHHAVQLRTGERLAGCDVYRSRHGVVADARITAPGGAVPDQVALLTSMIELLPELGGHTVESLVEAVRDGRLDAASVTRAMHRHLDVREAGLVTRA